MFSSRISDELGLQHGDTTALNQLMARYPYFETIHLLKAEAEKNNPNNTRTLHQAALVCNNPAWLQVLLSEKETVTTVVTATGKIQVEAAPEPDTHIPETTTVDTTNGMTEVAGNAVSANNGQPETITEAVENTVSVATNDTVTETTTVDTTNRMTEVAGNAVSANNGQPETIIEPVENTASVETNDTVRETVETPVEHQPIETVTVAEQATGNTEALAATTTETELPAFEPYHTVDYFASQGIKITKETSPTDRLSLQLKSFTEWLKTMKRLNTNDIEAANKPAQQEAVIQMAEISLQKTEVITETMAEVLVKQGRVDEAIEILKKLSLQDKAKSAYFAARIQHLKTI
jgi:hypothetical protein